MDQATAARRALRGPRSERERLQSLAGFHVLGEAREPEFDAIARLAARMASARIGAITFVDEGYERVKAATHRDLPNVARDDAFGAEIVNRAAALVVPDAADQERFAANPWVHAEPGVRFYAGVPLLAGSFVVGTLAVMDPEPRAAGSDVLGGLQDAVAVLMPALERRREEVLAQNLTAIIGFDGRVQHVSAAFESVLGWSPDELVGRDSLDFAHPADRERERARIDRLTRGHRGGGFESRYRCKEGGHRWLLWSSHVVAHEKRFYCAARDITDRKRNEMALRESEARYRMLAENATDIVSGHDLDGRLTYVSSAAEALTGWRPDEVVGKDVYDLFHPDDIEPVRERHRTLLERMQPVRYAYRLRRKDGTWIWVESNARVVRDQRSRPVGIQSATRDISEMKEATDALRAAREHFRRAFDDAPIGMCITTPDLRFERVNARLCELLGYTEEELLAEVHALSLVWPDDRRGTEYETARMLLSGQRQTYVDEQRLITRDGRPLWARLTTSLLRDHPGGEPRILTHVEDVSAQRRYAGELERANAAKSEFLSRMSHELRTPLNAVLGFAQLIEAEDDLSDSQRESVERVLRGGYHLLNLVNEVLDMSAVEAGQLAVTLETVPVAAVVDDALAMVRPLAGERSIRLHRDLPETAVAVSASEQRLKQVLLNLIANAVKYSPPGADVTVAVRQPDECRVCIDVTDTGPGIPADQIDRAFVPFERLGPPGQVEGTGLGLPLSRNLAEAMSGTLTVVSGAGGSTFTVELQAAEGSDATAVIEHEEGDRPDDTRGTGRRRRLLYIEDNDSNVALMERMAERRGDLDLHATSSGDAAVELARRLRPDLVVLDLHLADTDGYTVLAALRELEETSAVPVIVVSADVTQDHEPAVVAAGASAYLTKPLDLQHLQTEIDRALAG